MLELKIVNSIYFCFYFIFHLFLIWILGLEVSITLHMTVIIHSHMIQKVIKDS